MEYKEAVTEARTLVRRSEDDQWRLAQLTWEQLQAGHTQEQWAADVGMSRRSVRRFAAVWEQHGRATLANRPNWTDAVAEIDPSTRVGRERAKETVQQLPPEQRAAVVAEALEDPEVAERVVRGPARAPLARAETKVEREREQLARERYELAEPRSVQVGANADLQYALTKARSAFEDAAEAADTLAANGWPDNSREQGAALTQRALAAGELVRAKLEGRDLDAELQALLEGGEQA